MKLMKRSLAGWVVTDVYATLKSTTWCLKFILYQKLDMTLKVR
jgi:hypothetical protein